MNPRFEFDDGATQKGNMLEAPLVYALLSQNAYFPDHISNLPVNYQLFKQCPQKHRWWGYFGKAYFRIDRKTKTLNFIIAHSGTNNTFGFLEDLELWIRQILPAQYSAGAKPFMLEVLKEFKDYAAQEFPGYLINYEVTGHSLGAALAEKTIIDGEQKTLPKMFGLLFENPGLPPEQLPTQQDKTDDIVLINTVPDSVNTLFPTRGKHHFHISIDNDKYPRILGCPLPFVPNWIYYAYAYTFAVAHPISGIVDFLQSQNGLLQPMYDWPYGFTNAFENYKGYDTSVPNKNYWEGYIAQLWFFNGLESDILKIIFDDQFDRFKKFYIEYFLRSDAPFAQNIQVLQQQKTPKQIWAKLPEQQKQQFSHKFSKFNVYLQNFYQQYQPRFYPLIQDFFTLINDQVNHLILQSSATRNLSEDPYQGKFNALLAMKEKLIFYLRSGKQLNEKDLLNDICKRVLRSHGLSYLDCFPVSPDIFGLVPHTHADETLTGVREMYRSQLDPKNKKTKKTQGLLDYLTQPIPFSAQDYKNALLAFLKERLENLPKDCAKYKALYEINASVLTTKQASIIDIKKEIARVKDVVAEHRETKGIKGFFNQFRDTDSLNKFYEYFDDNINLRNNRIKILYPRF